jgi:hypothetical protein
MKFVFHNDIHGTTATITARGWRLTQRQVRRIWAALCGDLDCPACGYAGVQGPNKWRLKKLGGIFNEGAEIVENEN